MARPLSVGTAILMVLVCISACGGSSRGGAGPDAESSASASGTEGDASKTPTGSGGSGSGGGSADDGEEEFAYTPWGPSDPPIPTQYAALAASPGAAPRCDDVADAAPGGAFWSTVLGVCRAITGDGAWPETTTVPPPPPPDNPYQACLDEELTAMLQRALRWHADHPGQQPKVTYPSESSRSHCQSRIYEVRVLGVADLNPGESHPRGIGLAITGSAMDQDPSVTVDGQPAEFTGDFNIDQPEGDGITTVVVLAPAAQQPRTAKIEVSTYRGTLVATAKLPGRDEPSPSPETEDPATSPDGGDSADPSPTEASTAP